jgi:GR25 family glycosyltransferase involved in LPS biosynthesis
MNVKQNDTQKPSTDDSMNVKHCLIINLDTRPDLWDALKEHRAKMKEVGIHVERVPGVVYTGTPNLFRTLCQQKLLDLNSGGWRKNPQHMRNELGCFIAHYNALKMVIDKDWDNCLILEDGIKFLRTDFENLKIKKWLDVSIVHPNMKEAGEGIQGYVVTNSGARKMIKKLFPLKLPYDLALRNLVFKFELASYYDEPYWVIRNDKRQSSVGLPAHEHINNRHTLSVEERSSKQCFKPLYERLLEGIFSDNSIDVDKYILNEE